MKEHKQFTFLVAKGNSYSDDYGCFCSFCYEPMGWSENLNEADHREDCPMLQARQLLGNEWDKYLADAEEKQAELPRQGKQHCKICRGKVAIGEQALRQHQANSEKCKEKANGYL